MIVALARKLLIALWRETGLVPTGAARLIPEPRSSSPGRRAGPGGV